MRKINFKFIICILIFSILIFLTWNITAQHTWKEARKKYNLMLSSNYANIIYAFSANKEKDLLKVSTSIIRMQIIYIERANKTEIDSYNYLCPMLNSSFKKIILDNLYKEEKEYSNNKQEYLDKNITIDFKEERNDFKNGYEKLLTSCKG